MMRLTSIEFSLMLALKRVRGGKSHLKAPHVSQTVKHVGLYDFLWHKLQVQDRGEDDTSFVY